MEIFINWANVREDSVINFQSKVIKKLGSGRAFVLEIPLFIKLGMVTSLDNAQRQV
jgi:hypothetical protein